MGIFTKTSASQGKIESLIFSGYLKTKFEANKTIKGNAFTVDLHENGPTWKGYFNFGNKFKKIFVKRVTTKF